MNDMTYPANPSALPDGWVDRLFLRLAALYGKAWHDTWADVPMPVVKATWADALAHVGADSIKKALDYCSGNLKFPPTCPEFVGVCRQFRSDANPLLRLSPPVFKPEPVDTRIAEILAKQFAPGRKRNPKDWARKVMARKDAGDRLPAISVEFAREALGIVPREPGCDDE